MHFKVGYGRVFSPKFGGRFMPVHAPVSPLASAIQHQLAGSPAPPFDPGSVFRRPERAIEARAWLKKNAGAAARWRGRAGESLLHWACMSDLGLLLDVIDAGVDPNALDESGRTPLDWLNDRLWVACIDGTAGLNAEGQWRLRAQTETLLPALWARGGRAGKNAPAPGRLWVRAGAWPLLDLLREDGLDGWMSWPPTGETVLHGWALAPERSEKHRFLTRALAAGLAVDAPDAEGRTPLWYAVDAWLSQPSYAPVLEKAAAALVAAGADPALAPPGLAAPAELPLTRRAAEDVARAIENVWVHDATQAPSLA